MQRSMLSQWWQVVKASPAGCAARAGAQLQLHEPTVERMRESYAKRGMELNAARLRMATLPSPAEVLFTEGTWVPLVNLNG